MNRSFRYTCIAICLVTSCLVSGVLAPSVSADTPALLRIFGRASKIEANADTVYELSQEDGPWMILASTLVGEGARERANRLAIEIRRDLGVKAFIYKEEFDFTGNPFKQSAGKRVRYANRYRYDAYAVLVGEYDRIDHPRVEKDLARIKTAIPKVLEDPNEMAAELSQKTPVTTVKIVATKLKAMTLGDGKPGPMAGAFVTRNPMLPEDFFEEPTVDSFVRQLNEDFPENNLLECDGKFTVVVKTFGGLKTIAGSKESQGFAPSGDRLDRIAEDAAYMVAKLRGKGIEAYQFHNREHSLVTIGSFDSLGRSIGDGGFQYSPEIVRVMRQYSALNVNPKIASQVKQVNGKFAGNHVAMIPFDVQPTPIAVPKLSRRRF